VLLSRETARLPAGALEAGEHDRRIELAEPAYGVAPARRHACSTRLVVGRATIA
jgi:hypothetical protein